MTLHVAVLAVVLLLFVAICPTVNVQPTLRKRIAALFRGLNRQLRRRASTT